MIRHGTQQNACMASITIRDVPEDVRAELAARAARGGRSMQEYLRLQLVELAATPDVEDVLTRIRERKQRTSSTLSVTEIVSGVRADRR